MFFHNVCLGGLVVTTPQQLATQVAGRGVTMFRKLGVPIIGVVQNMGTVICSNCKHKNELFGPAINKFAKDLGLYFLLLTFFIIFFIYSAYP